ncbi:hypothetical protein [Streptomyces gardneri]|uniref:hypothetical protein n=1 Tax=Streptomyces gardneri TaxID=66892 RepID=UPI0035D5B4B4
MAMAETIVAAVSGLGGAGIGVMGVLLAQRAKRRDDAAAATVAAKRAQQTTQLAAERSESEVTLEIVATARVSVRSWLTFMQQVLMDLEQGRGVDAQQFDVQLQEELKAFTSALYRLAGRPPLSPAHDQREVYHQPFVDMITRISHSIRDVVVRQPQTPITTLEGARLRDDAQSSRDQINGFLLTVTEVRIQPRADDRPIPRAYHQLAAPAHMVDEIDRASGSTPQQPDSSPLTPRDQPPVTESPA